MAAQTSVTIHGTCNPRFEAVQWAFERNFIEHADVGAAVAVVVDSGGLRSSGMTRLAVGGFVALTVQLLACGALPLAFETPSPVPASRSVAFAPQLCAQYDEYQAASFAFFTISHLASAEADRATGSSGSDASDALSSTVEHFVEEIRRAERGEPPDPSDPVSEFAALWVRTGGCVGSP